MQGFRRLEEEDDKAKNDSKKACSRTGAGLIYQGFSKPPAQGNTTWRPPTDVAVPMAAESSARPSGLLVLSPSAGHVSDAQAPAGPANNSACPFFRPSRDLHLCAPLPTSSFVRPPLMRRTSETIAPQVFVHHEDAPDVIYSWAARAPFAQGFVDACHPWSSEAGGI